jgi:hypothetical protein
VLFIGGGISLFVRTKLKEDCETIKRALSGVGGATLISKLFFPPTSQSNLLNHGAIKRLNESVLFWVFLQWFFFLPPKKLFEERALRVIARKKEGATYFYLPTGYALSVIPLQKCDLV